MTQTTKIQLQDYVAAMFKFNNSTPQPKDSNMLKPATNADIVKMITDMIAGGEMFTNYDVTKKLRSANFHVMHNDVKTAVSGFDFPYYYATTTTHSTGAPSILHYPDHKDAKQYDPKAIPEPVIPVALKKVTVGPNGTVSATTTANDPKVTTSNQAGIGIPFKCGSFSSAPNHVGCAGPQGTIGTPGTHVLTAHTHKATRIAGSDTTFDKRGRCHVASRFMQQAGFAPNQSVKVSVDTSNKRIYISEPDNTSIPGLIEIDYTADNHTAVRIAASTFKKAFSYSDVVKVTVENKKVTLSR